jgi:oxygen-independent coproporphyrinogen-3 oxidase
VTKAQPDAKAEPNDDETRVGSYFVANYPPFSFWKSDFVGEVERVLEEQPSPDTPAGLYLHVPFCRKRCKFCYFRVYTDKNAKDVQRYLEAVLTEARLLSKRPALERPLRFVYVGGGTPSFLSVPQLETLFHGLEAVLPFRSAEEITFECEPGTLNERKVNFLKDAGVTRLSLGVENFHDAILEENGRAHLSAEIEEAWQWIQSARFPAVNIDLIAGMVGETDTSWDDNVDKALALEPDSLTIYQMELPFNTVYSNQALQGGSAPHVASWPQKREWVRRAFERFQDAGYHVSSGYTLVRDPERVRFVYRDALWHGADMIGMGVASFSYVGGVHYQNLDKFNDYVGALERGHLPLSRALPIEDRERLIRELILQMKLGRVDAAYFRDKFQVEIAEDFSEPLSSLSDIGLLEQHGDQIELTTKGLLRVDTFLPRFFLPKHQAARYT